MTVDQMYQEFILDYYRNPRNFGTLENSDVTLRDSNPACGDIIEMQINFNDKHIKEIKFNGKGCAISQAAASMLTEQVQGKSAEEILKMNKQEVLEMLGVPVSPMRLKCALLGFKVLKLCLCQQLGNKLSEEDQNL